MHVYQIHIQYGPIWIYYHQRQGYNLAKIRGLFSRYVACLRYRSCRLPQNCESRATNFLRTGRASPQGSSVMSLQVLKQSKDVSFRLGSTKNWCCVLAKSGRVEEYEADQDAFFKHPSRKVPSASNFCLVGFWPLVCWRTLVPYHTYLRSHTVCTCVYYIYR